MPMELQGFDNLRDDLTNMASNLEFGAGVNHALQEGAKPIEEQMLHNASSDPKIITGALHGSIRTHSVRKARSGGKYITIGVKHSEKGAYYANPVEKGHGGPAPAPAHPTPSSAPSTKIRTSVSAPATKAGILSAVSEKASRGWPRTKRQASRLSRPSAVCSRWLLPLRLSNSVVSQVTGSKRHDPSFPCSHSPWV